ncbi:Uncharacterized protein FWK35_00008399, partial [Aphis craccivora]
KLKLYYPVIYYYYYYFFGVLHDCILDSEWSDECIDYFTMVCVSVYTRTCRNNASISNYGGGFRWQNESC